MNLQRKSTSLFLFIVALMISFSGIHISYKLGSAKEISDQTVKLRHNKKLITSNYILPNQYKIDVVHYNIKLDLYPDKKILCGEVEITLIPLDKNLKTIDLNFYDNLNIEKVIMNGMKADFSNIKTSLTIHLNSPLKDTISLQITYNGTPKKLGLSSFVFGEINGKHLTYSLNEPEYASTWFPCNDIPSDKALMDMYITSDSSKISISNGKLIGISSSGSRKTYHWKSNYPISSYLICLYSSEFCQFDDTYVSVNGNTMPLTYYVLPERLEKAKKDWEEHKEYLKVFEILFGEYPFIDEKYGVAEFLWQMGAMEHQTITGIGTSFVDGKRQYSDIYIHELAHQWWGDAVGPATWDDIWLNEGFATYSEALYFEFVEGKHALQEYMSDLVDEYKEGTLYKPGEDLFSSKVYNKGAWVVHMLRSEIGDSNFFSLLKKYYQLFKYKNASTDDLKKLTEQISGKSLEQFFNQWVYDGEGIIKLDYKWKVKKENNEWLLYLEIEQTQHEYFLYHFPIEIKIQYDKANDNIYKKYYITDKIFKQKIRLENYPNDIELDPHKWLLADINDKNNYE